jgi:hypothetical protein
MEQLSDRHEGTLDGLLAPLDAGAAATVAVEIDAQAARTAAGQHTAWMLINLLARQEGVVTRIALSCPSGVPLRGRVVPLAARDRDLATALLEGAAAIGAVPVHPGSAPAALRLVVGPGPAIPGAARVWGERAWGGYSNAGVTSADAESPLPLGPYAAACLAAGYVFTAVRRPNAPKPPAAFYSLWSFIATAEPPGTPAGTGPHDIAARLDLALAGCGAVGSAWLHTIWASPAVAGRALIADADKEGVDLSNLNRCVTFGRASDGLRKATEAAGICADAGIALIPHDGRVEDAGELPPLLLSAVDTNAARRAVQGLYPARVIAASTENMRAELLRCDPVAGAPCLCCFNPPEAEVPDAELRRRFLAASSDRQRDLAEAVGQTLTDAIAWATEGVCGYAGDRVMAHMRTQEPGARAFAVGFASVMAGLMLAAQTFKDALAEGPLAGPVSRVVMQFVDPLAATNRPRRYLRDSSCAMCSPSTPAGVIWAKRYRAA